MPLALGEPDVHHTIHHCRRGIHNIFGNCASPPCRTSYALHGRVWGRTFAETRARAGSHRRLPLGSVGDVS